MIRLSSQAQSRRDEAWNVSSCDHAFNSKSFQSAIFQIRQLNVPNQRLEPRSTHLTGGKFRHEIKGQKRYRGPPMNATFRFEEYNLYQE